MKKKNKKKELIRKIKLLLIALAIICFVFLVLKGVEIQNSEKEVSQYIQEPTSQNQFQNIPSASSKKTNPPSNPAAVQEPNYVNFVNTLSKNEMISDIPKEGSISLNTYNFETGEREIEKTYLLKKDSVVESSEPGEIYVNFHSKYVNQINSNNLCEILTKANNNGDFGAWTEMETSSLMWKYKGMLKYRDCLGF